MFYHLKKTHTRLSLFMFVVAAMASVTFTPAVTAGPGHAGADSSHQATSADDTWSGDPYPLATDPVSGEALGDEPVVIDHDGRELRFTNEANVEKFRAAPDEILAKLDQQIIENQMPYYPMTTCPISGDKLGGDMGEPVNLVYRNRLVRFCCKFCKGEFKKDPAATIRKLDAAVIAQQGEKYPLTTCPVSGQKLGSMGELVEMVVANRLVKLCCAGCKGKFMARPAEVLSEIDAAWEASDAKPGVAGAEHRAGHDDAAKPSHGHDHDSHDLQH